MKFKSANVALVALISSAVGLVPSAAHAEGQCVSSGAAYFDGTESYRNTNVFGARARIEYRNPTLCNSGENTGVSLAWTMVTARSVAHPGDSHYDGYAQVGYVKFGGAAGSLAGSHVFSQWTRQCKVQGYPCPNGETKTIYLAAPSARSYCAVYRRASSDRIVLDVDGETISTMGYDTQGIWRPEWQGQFYGETFHVGDNMPGNKTNKTDFDYLQRYGSAGGLNFFTNAELKPLYSSVPNYYWNETFSPAGGGFGFRIWTDPA